MELRVQVEPSGDAITLRLVGGTAGAAMLPIRGTLSERGAEIDRFIRPLAITPTAVQSRSGATIGATGALITDPATGKYPHDSPNRRELLRALRFAAEVWGAERSWETIDESDWVRLLRHRMDDLLAKKCAAVRSTEITMSRLITAVTWLRESRHIARDGAPWPKKFKDEITRYWKGKSGSIRDPQPHRPRFTPEEAQQLLRSSSFDPRFQLLMWLGCELRLGQVCRALRSDLRLSAIDWSKPVDIENDETDYGTFTVYGAGKKHGTVVDLTRGQRRMLDHAFGSTGYHADMEARLQAKAIDDYPLFPSGYMVGRVGRMRGKDTALHLGKSANYSRHVSSAWVRGAFRCAEKLAGIEHVKGRGAYGVRRVGRDVAEGLSQSAIENFGGWTPGSSIPNAIYRETANRAGRREARGARAKLRGEGDE